MLFLEPQRTSLLPRVHLFGQLRSCSPCLYWPPEEKHLFPLGHQLLKLVCSKPEIIPAVRCYVAKTDKIRKINIKRGWALCFSEATRFGFPIRLRETQCENQNLSLWRKQISTAPWISELYRNWIQKKEWQEPAKGALPDAGAERCQEWGRPLCCHSHSHTISSLWLYELQLLSCSVSFCKG